MPATVNGSREETVATPIYGTGGGIRILGILGPDEQPPVGTPEGSVFLIDPTA